MSFALPSIVVKGNVTKIQIRRHPGTNIAVYRCDWHNKSSHPTFEVINPPSGQYPPKPGRHLSGFTREYDALARFHDLIGRTPLTLIAPLKVLPGPKVLPPPPIVVDGKRRGGHNAE